MSASKRRVLFTRMWRAYPVKTVVALLAVVVIVLGAVVIYPSIGLGPTASRNSTSSTSVVSTSSLSNSTIAAKTTSSTSSGVSFNFALSNSPNTIVIAPGANLTYASVDILPVPSAVSGTELVALSATPPSGIHINLLANPVSFSPATLSVLNPVLSVHFALAADKSVAPGDYKVAVVGTSGPLSASSSFTVRVVPYLIIVKDNTYYPANLTVKAGATVYWINLGIPSGGDNAQEFDVTFKTVNVRSSVLVGAPAYDLFSYTFTTVGTYPYNCAQADDCNFPYMNGEIIVTG